MRQIERRMLEALAKGENFHEANTQVVVKKGRRFVYLYSTIIYAKVGGREYYSDDGYNTPTTASRLRALGADYSTNPNKRTCKLTPQRKMIKLCYAV